MEFIVHIRHTTLLTSMLLTLVSASLPAVDEEYFIPYTDNYGYEYDPETGTYVQKESTAVVTPQASQQSTQQTILENNRANVSAQPDLSRTETIDETDSDSNKLPVLIGTLVGILLISFALVKIFRKQDL